MHAKQMQALDLIPQVAVDFEARFKRHSGGLLSGYRTDDAETVVVALGSVLGTIEDVIDELREEGARIGAVGLKCFRPFPLDEVREALAEAKRVIVVEKAFAVGAGGIVGQNVRLALSGLETQVHNVAAGLGGRPIKKKSLRALFERVLAGELGSRLEFLDMDRKVVERELRRGREGRPTGPHAESILRDAGIVGARYH
jgi:pyruvate ferredoxin oxidoreductase alpha subunit